MAQLLACDLDGEIIREEPELGERQGGPVEIRYPSHTQTFVLCSKCMAKLDVFRDLGERSIAGTLPARDALYYLPRED